MQHPGRHGAERQPGDRPQAAAAHDDEFAPEVPRERFFDVVERADAAAHLNRDVERLADFVDDAAGVV